MNNIGYWAFIGCNSLTSINIPSSVTSIGGSAFESCTSLTIVNFDNDSQLTTIGAQAFFNCCSLKTIAIPSGLTQIGPNAFNECIALKSINIPSSVTSIGETAFANCDKMGTITFNWNEEQLSKLTLGNNLIRNDTSSQKINFHIPWGTKDQYNAKFTQDILGTNVTANWIENNPPAPSSNSNLPLILGLTFGFIILIVIGSYFGYRYYKHRKNSKK